MFHDREYLHFSADTTRYERGRNQCGVRMRISVGCDKNRSLAYFRNKRPGMLCGQGFHCWAGRRERGRMTQAHTMSRTRMSCPEINAIRVSTSLHCATTLTDRHVGFSPSSTTDVADNRDILQRVYPWSTRLAIRARQRTPTVRRSST